ncbi:MAG: lysoplasmalogenase [Candidatus Hydrogenedentota bacterium]
MPTTMSIVYAVLALGSIALNIIAPFSGVGIIKALPALLLTGAAWRYTRPRFGNAVTLGILCGAAGDYFLASLSQDWLMPGLIAFLIGHGFYLRAFARDLHMTAVRLGIVGVVTACTAVLAIFTVRALLATGQANLIAPFLLYAAVLLIMMAVCLFHRSPAHWIAAGAVVFVVSDGHIVVNHLLLAAPLLPLTLTGYTTYYLAQYLIVAGAARETAVTNAHATAPRRTEDEEGAKERVNHE